MKEFTSILNIKSISLDTTDMPESEMLYFDIETTGFSVSNTMLYLICVAYQQGDKYYITQWFADSSDSEIDVLKAFINFAKGFKALITYNGNGFDIPYIAQKCQMYSLDFCPDDYISIDIYKSILPLKSIFKLENLKQKTMEKFIGINREDKYSGGQLINVYNKYLAANDDRLLYLLLTHNKEDVMGLIAIKNIINYTDIYSGNFEINNIELRSYVNANSLEKKEVVVELNLSNILPVRVSYGNDVFYITAYDRTAKVSIGVYTDELKFFYPNYKDYYYLPEEDRSIHKSVAFYVDKNYRTKARAANCYSKKTGTFLPQYKEIISPYFKIDYYDKVCYFEYTEDFTSNKDLIKQYICHIISILFK